MPPRVMLTLVLLATTIASSAYATATTINYFQFYPALTSLKLNLTFLQLTTNTNTALEGIVSFTLESPSDYKGIGLKDIQPSLEIELNHTTRIPQGIILANTPKGALDPKLLTKFSIPFQATQNTPQQVNATLTRGEEVKFIFTLNLILTTFLDRMALIVAIHECDTTGPPATCQQIEIRIQPTRDTLTGGPRGGGR